LHESGVERPEGDGSGGESMICPTGEPVHENLSPEYTDVPQLLSTLRAEGFSGTIVIEAIGKKGTFFLSNGETIDAAAGTASDPTATVGEEAVEELFVLCTQPEAKVGVYKLSAREAEFAANTLQSEILFRGLSTDYVRLDRFLGKLSCEKHNGYIEVFNSDNEVVGVLCFRNGQMDQFLRVSESGSLVFFDSVDIPAFLEEISMQGMHFNVCRTAMSPRANEIDQVGDTESEVNQEMLTETRIQGSNGTAPYMSLQVEEEKPRGDELEKRTQFLLDLQRALFKIEKFVSGCGQKSGFQRVFRRVCVEKAESYPFLDPFEGRFEYSDGRIHIDDGVSTEAFIVGVADCLNLTLAYLQRELPKRTILPVGLKRDIESSFGRFRNVLAGSGMQSVVPAAFC
jgi:hypothetical protein